MTLNNSDIIFKKNSHLFFAFYNNFYAKLLSLLDPLTTLDVDLPPLWSPDSHMI